MTLVVTPDVLRTTKQAIEAAIEHATAIGRDYLNNHEGIASGVWDGGAKMASVATATQVSQDLMQIMTGGARLAGGLEQAAALMEQHEEDAAQTLTSFTPASINL